MLARDNAAGAAMLVRVSHLLPEPLGWGVGRPAIAPLHLMARPASQVELHEEGTSRTSPACTCLGASGELTRTAGGGVDHPSPE
jgi:hypothetical protein